MFEAHFNHIMEDVKEFFSRIQKRTPTGWNLCASVTSALQMSFNSVSFPHLMTRLEQLWRLGKFNGAC
jgi:hypothetical protein